MDKKAIKTSGKILLSFCKGSTSMNLANVFVKSFFIDRNTYKTVSIR